MSWRTLDTEGHPISSDRDAPGGWVHDDSAHVGHADPIPELRFAVDATCPACGWVEMGFAPARGLFSCSRCRHEQEARPAV